MNVEICSLLAAVLIIQILNEMLNFSLSISRERRKRMKIEMNCKLCISPTWNYKVSLEWGRIGWYDKKYLPSSIASRLSIKAGLLCTTLSLPFCHNDGDKLATHLTLIMPS